MRKLNIANGFLGLVIFGLIAFGADQALGDAAHVNFDKLIPHYLATQEALASDSLDKAKEGAKALSAAINKESDHVKNDKTIKALQLSANKLQSAKDIKEARKQFKSLSEPLVKWSEKNKSDNIMIAYCPMAGAKWLQKDGEISNPYFGSEMKMCGEKVK